MPAPALWYHGVVNNQIPTKQRGREHVAWEILSAYWLRIQEELLPWLDDTMIGPLSGYHRQLVSVLGLARIEAFLPGWQGPARAPAI